MIMYLIYMLQEVIHTIDLVHLYKIISRFKWDYMNRI